MCSPPDGRTTERARRVGCLRSAGGWRNNPKKQYLPLTDDVVTAHLSGEMHIGLYPLLDDDTCHWLAADFDGAAAMLDALSYLKAARAIGVYGGLGGLPIGNRRSCLDILHRSRSRRDRPKAGHRTAAGSDSDARPDGSVKLRPLVSVAGCAPRVREYREPDRGTVAGSLTKGRRDGLRRLGHARAARRPVGILVRSRSAVATRRRDGLQVGWQRHASGSPSIDSPRRPRPVPGRFQLQQCTSRSVPASASRWPT